MIEEKKMKKAHNLILENRKSLMISGIDDVDSFDEAQITVFTEEGLLTIRGEDLHINKLSIDIGELSVEGNIYSLSYQDEQAKTKGGLFTKLFK